MTSPFTPAEVESYVKGRLPDMRIVGPVARGCCPFHKGKPGAFVINLPSGGFWRCFECNRHGGLVDLEAELTVQRAATAEILRMVGRTSEVIGKGSESRGDQ